MFSCGSRRFNLATAIVTISLGFVVGGCAGFKPDALTPKDYLNGELTPEGMRKLTELGKSYRKNWTGGNNFVSKVRDAMPSLKSSKPFQAKPAKRISAKSTFSDQDPASLAKAAKEIGPQLQLSAARLAEQQGRPDVAREQYQKVLAVDSGNRNALIGLARLSHRGGDTLGAIQTYRQALSAHPNDAVIMNDLGLCYAQNGQLDESIEVLRRATQFAPDRTMYVNNLATALVEANRSNEAVAYLSKVHGVSKANMQVGYLLSQTGQLDAADAYLNHALELDPTLSQARSLLDQMSPRVSARPSSTSRTHETSTSPVLSPVQPVNPLNDPQAYLPNKGTAAPKVPNNDPAHLKKETVRIGPFGFAPQNSLNEVDVVSFVEEIE